jgi:hypothetical protein
LAFAAALVGLVLSAGVAVHEWLYHQDHPHQTGVSGVLVVLAIAVALGCASVMKITWATRLGAEERAARGEEKRRAEREAEEHEEWKRQIREEFFGGDEGFKAMIEEWKRQSGDE